MKRKSLFESPVKKHNPFISAGIMFFLLIISTSSICLPESEMQKDSTPGEKKLKLLEMLEKGTKLSSEEIKATFSCDNTCSEPFMPVPGDINEMMLDLGNEIEHIGRSFGDFLNSGEFREDMEKLRIERENLMKEIGKIKEEMKKAFKEIDETVI